MAKYQLLSLVLILSQIIILVSSLPTNSDQSNGDECVNSVWTLDSRLFRQIVRFKRSPRLDLSKFGYTITVKHEILISYLLIIK